MIIYCIRGKENLESQIDNVIYKKFDKDKESDSDNKNNEEKNEDNDDQLKVVKANNKVYKKRKSIKKGKKRGKNVKKIIAQENGSNSNSKSLMDKLNNKEEKTNISGLNEAKEGIEGKDKIITVENKEDINEKEKYDDIPDKENDYELNTLPYDLAIKYDKRSCCDYYTSLLKSKQIFMFTFCSFTDYNSGIIKKFVLFLSFAYHYTISALFFNDDTFHQIYEDNGSYNFGYQFPKVLLSAIASTVFMRIILETLVLTERNILQVKQQKTRKEAVFMKNNVLKNIKIKFLIFFIINLITLFLFWIYLIAFNDVYENTQFYLLENTAISFCLSFFYPVVWNIIPCIFRIYSLSSNQHDKQCMYFTSKILQLI